MISTSAVGLYNRSGVAANRISGEIARSLLRLMAALESSLEGGRKALLALDLSGLGARTQEQILLCHELAAVLEQAGREGDALPGRLESAKGLGTLPLQLEEVQMMAKHIVSAVRLQCALLARSRTKLRVMANMLAGPGAAYGPRLAERL